MASNDLSMLLSQTFQSMSLDGSPHSKSAETEPAPVVSINHADYSWAEMKVVNLLEDLLVNERKPIVIFREGNFTFSIALAALRGSSWDGIVSTVKHESPVQNWWVNSKKLSIKYCVLNASDYEKPDSKKRTASNILDVFDLPSPPAGALMYAIADADGPGGPLSAEDRIFRDSTTLPRDRSVKNKVVWYQCPWIQGHPGCEIYDLILKFLKCVGKKQSENDYVLIGIVNQFPYVKEYELYKLQLFGENPSGPVQAYEFLGADNTLIEKIIRFGYKHETVNNDHDIHEKILFDHLTLVFKHK